MDEGWLARECRMASIEVLARAIAKAAPEEVINRATPEELKAAEVIVEEDRQEMARLVTARVG